MFIHISKIYTHTHTPSSAVRPGAALGSPRLAGHGDPHAGERRRPARAQRGAKVGKTVGIPEAELIFAVI